MPFYYVLDPVMASRASTKPLAMFDSAEGDVDISEESQEEDEADDPNDPDFVMFEDGDLGEISDELISNEITALDEEDLQQQVGRKEKNQKKNALYHW